MIPQPTIGLTFLHALGDISGMLYHMSMSDAERDDYLHRILAIGAQVARAAGAPPNKDIEEQANAMKAGMATCQCDGEGGHNVISVNDAIDCIRTATEIIIAVISTIVTDQEEHDDLVRRTQRLSLELAVHAGWVLPEEFSSIDSVVDAFMESYLSMLRKDVDNDDVLDSEFLSGAPDTD